MPRRPTRRWPVLPLRLQQIPIEKSDQDRIERSRPKPDLEPQLIAIPPRRGVRSQGVQHLHGLRRWTACANHADKSTYIENEVNGPSCSRPSPRSSRSSRGKITTTAGSSAEPTDRERRQVRRPEQRRRGRRPRARARSARGARDGAASAGARPRALRDRRSRDRPSRTRDNAAARHDGRRRGATVGRAVGAATSRRGSGSETQDDPLDLSGGCDSTRPAGVEDDALPGEFVSHVGFPRTGRKRPDGHGGQLTPRGARHPFRRPAPRHAMTSTGVPEDVAASGCEKRTTSSSPSASSVIVAPSRTSSAISARPMRVSTSRWM
jgi:hypothetical protein